MKKIKSNLFIVVAIILVTFYAYYIQVSEDTIPKDSKMDILKFSFVFAVIWCLSGWLGCIIADKIDDGDKVVGQEEKLCAIILAGPILFFMMILQYFKQKKRAKYTQKELLGQKKGIYDFLERIFGGN